MAGIWVRLSGFCLLALALAGCATREVGTVRPTASAAIPFSARTSADECAPGKVVWITIDGTSNTPVSRTAAARLHEMVEAFSYAPGHQLAIWYAEGVGSADHDIAGKALGAGINDDIKKAYAFLTQVWRPCDPLFLNGFSRGAFSVRALGGLLYMAGIPDLSAMSERERGAVVDDLFDAYKTRVAYPGLEGLARRRADRIAAVYARHGLDRVADPLRAAGFGGSGTKVEIQAMTIWDTVQALGLPDGSEDPTEGPAHFLMTACNVRSTFHPLALDDNRVYSFTPILAGGARATELCPKDGDRQNVSEAIEEVWFSGAHADVGGTYGAGAMLDGELASVSLNWMLDRLRSRECPECQKTLAFPEQLRVPENRLTAIHDGKATSFAYRKLYRQSRKPRVYWYHVYGRERRTAVHASVFDRLEWLFALDETTPGCDGAPAPGKPVICAEEIASHGLVPELLKENCLEPTDWGYRLPEKQGCVKVIGTRSVGQPAGLPTCLPRPEGAFVFGMNYIGDLKDTNRRVVKRDEYEVPLPRCRAAKASTAPRSRPGAMRTRPGER